MTAYDFTVISPVASSFFFSSIIYFYFISKYDSVCFMLVLFVVFRSICFMQTLLCCGLYELGLQVCVQTSCSSDSLTSVFNLFNPLSLALSLSALRLIFLLHDVCLEISTFAVFLMTVNTCERHVDSTPTKSSLPLLSGR